MPYLYSDRSIVKTVRTRESFGNLGSAERAEPRRGKNPSHIVCYLHVTHPGLCLPEFVGLLPNTSTTSYITLFIYTSSAPALLAGAWWCTGSGDPSGRPGRGLLVIALQLNLIDSIYTAVNLNWLYYCALSGHTLPPCRTLFIGISTFIDVVDEGPRGHDSSTLGAADCAGDIYAGNDAGCACSSRILKIHNVNMCLESLALLRDCFDWRTHKKKSTSRILSLTHPGVGHSNFLTWN